MVTFGALFLLLLVFSFTRIPFDMQRWLGTEGAGFKFSPSVIVMLGGSGMPSESNLIRLNYTKNLALIFPDSKIMIAHPSDTAVVNEMIDFLVAFGITPDRIHTKSHGLNTREQAMELIEIYPGITHEKVVIITSPENMYRTMRTFRKLEFESIGGVSAFENAMFVDLSYNFKKLGGKEFVPDVSGNLGLRYNFWNYLKIEISCLREFVAILYYKVNGWI